MRFISGVHAKRCDIVSILVIFLHDMQNMSSYFHDLCAFRSISFTLHWNIYCLYCTYNLGTPSLRYVAISNFSYFMCVTSLCAFILSSKYWKEICLTQTNWLKSYCDEKWRLSKGWSNRFFKGFSFFIEWSQCFCKCFPQRIL